jgi:hypothetical protein
MYVGPSEEPKGVARITSYWPQCNENGTDPSSSQ